MSMIPEESLQQQELLDKLKKQAELQRQAKIGGGSVALYAKNDALSKTKGSIKALKTKQTSKVIQEKSKDLAKDSAKKGLSSVQGAGVNTAAGMIDQGGETQSTSAGAAGGAMKGAVMGAQMGGAPGAIAGAVIGGLSGGLGARAKKKEAARKRFAEAKRAEANVIGQADQRKQMAIANLINSFQGVELGGSTVIG